MDSELAVRQTDSLPSWEKPTTIRFSSSPGTFSKRGKITISGFMIQEGREKKICLCVKDNGVGMEEEELKRLQKEITRPCQETESGFGLANVNERLRMNFGMAYGLTILSQKGEGTIPESP